MKFEEAVKVILRYEGGYVFDSEDPGGETKFGISKRSYPTLNIKELTPEQASSLYKMDYWDRIEADRMPEPIRLIMFDCAVNQGVKRAIRILQGAIGVQQDSILSPMTFLTLQECAPGFIVKEIAKARHQHYCQLPHWERFGKGWSKRLLEIVLESIEIL